MAGASRIRFHADSEHADARSGENCDGAGIGGIFERNRIARAQKSFADKVDGLLAAIGDQKLLAANLQAFGAKQFDQDALERLVAVG